MKIGALISGGKDGIYALDLIKKEGHEVVSLISLKSKREDSWMFHTPNIDIVKLTAKAINLPLVYKETPGEMEKELDDLEEAIKEAKEKYKIRGLVSGAIDSIYQKSRVDNICKKLKLKSFAPLWHRNQLDIIDNMIDEGYKIKIVSIAADGFNKYWLGRNIDFETLEELKELNNKYEISIAGEGGEYESLVLCGPIFNKKIKIIKVKKEMENECTGSYVISEAELI